MQGRSKRGHVAELGIGEDRGHRDLGGARLAEQTEGQSPFFLKPDRVRNARLPPCARRHPFLRQIEHRAEAPRPHAGPERGRHRDLAIGDLAQRPTVLPRDADRRWPLFGKARAVEDQHAAAFGEHGAQPTPDAVRIPRGMGNEMLERLGGDRLGHPRQHGLHRLSLAVAEHAVDVRPQRHQLSTMAKAALELLQPSDQSLHARRRSGIDQCASRYPNREKSTMSSKAISADLPSETLDLTKSN
jgi:hypothetical protein